MALNNTGDARAEDYALGRGRLFFGQLDADGRTVTGGLRFLGNATEFNVNLNTETAAHQASYTQLRQTDARCTLSLELGVSFVLDELNFQNYADFFIGETASLTNATGSIATHVLTTAAVGGRWYPIHNSAGARLYNLDDDTIVFNLEINGGADLVEGTDYEIDKQMGLVKIFETPGTVGVIGAQIDVDVTTAAASGLSLDKVNAATRSDVKGVLLFESLDGCDSDKKRVFNFRRVSLTPDGDHALIGDDFASMSFSGVAEVNSAFSAAEGRTLEIVNVDALA